MKYPERVRIYEVPQIPIPKHPILRAAAEATQLISAATIGISLRYGIFIHNNFSKDRYTIAHELVHTMQCEKFGGFYPFLKKYLWECIEIGYPEAGKADAISCVSCNKCLAAMPNNIPVKCYNKSFPR